MSERPWPDLPPGELGCPSPELARRYGLSEPELVNMVFTLILAGHETTAAMISRGIFRLLLHPGQLAELREDPELLAPAVEEVMRSGLDWTRDALMYRPVRLPAAR
ncbi:cytochrome P450 [Actinocorallia longicatena]